MHCFVTFERNATYFEQAFTIEIVYQIVQLNKMCMKYVPHGMLVSICRNILVTSFLQFSILFYTKPLYFEILKVPNMHLGICKDFMLQSQEL